MHPYSSKLSPQQLEWLRSKLRPSDRDVVDKDNYVTDCYYRAVKALGKYQGKVCYSVKSDMATAIYAKRDHMDDYVTVKKFVLRNDVHEFYDGYIDLNALIRAKKRYDPVPFPGLIDSHF